MRRGGQRFRGWRFFALSICSTRSSRLSNAVNLQSISSYVQKDEVERNEWQRDRVTTDLQAIM